MLHVILEVACLRRASSFFQSKFVISEDEWIPFRSENFDGAISCLNSHWIENLKSNLVPMFKSCIT